MTAIATPRKTARDAADPAATASAAKPAPRPLLAALLRLAWIGRGLWHRVARPLTMGVRALILDESDPTAARILLIRHSYVGGWHMPGGGVGKGETLAEAMRREVREEVGLRVEGETPPLGIYARFRNGASDHVTVFVVRGWSGTPKADGVEIVEARFFAVDRLPADLSPATRRRLEEFLGGKPPAARW
ncbi:NUDIX domain-containing protein [Azospirillum agricola]|uniref:NUDIX domain-containing protein n=1 Tax=Azospirillum agricola TaxID=1720247 RepID=UPI000A0F0D9C|nr:NUDIX domain-containing protein [Azospirillum agricola]SMH54817.1 ADP-ribose pyrophosphatase YjhB, NUDIX family [Azospirillum lipoferum]